MNWNEFLRTMTWFISFFAVVGTISFGVFASDYVGRRSLLVVAAVICVIIAVFGFSVIGGMNWGPPQ